MSQSNRSTQQNRTTEATAGVGAAVLTLLILGVRFGLLEDRYAVTSLPIEAGAVLLVAIVTSLVFTAALHCRPARTVTNLVVVVHAGAASVTVFAVSLWIGLTAGFAGLPKSGVMFAVQSFVGLFYIGLGLLFAAGVGALVAAGSATGTYLATLTSQ